MTRPVSSSLPRRLAGAAAAVVALGSLAACAAGQSAQTSQPYNPADGRNVNVPADASFDEDYVGIRNAVVVSAAGNGSLLVTMVNNSSESDWLEGVRVGDQAMTISEQPVEIEPGEAAKAGFDSELTISVEELSAAPGDWVTLEFAFRNMGQSTLDVLVVPYGDDYVSNDLEAPIVIPTPTEEGAEVFEAEVETTESAG